MIGTVNARLAALTLAVLTGCDVAMLPETATYDGAATPRMSVVVEVDAMPPGGVQAVDFELVDVYLHRQSDDTWVWVAGGIDKVQLDPDTHVQSEPVPMLADVYDGVRVVIDSPRVASAGTWHRADLVSDTLELVIDTDVEDDATLELRFDLSASLSGSEGGAWAFAPKAEVAMATP